MHKWNFLLTILAFILTKLHNHVQADTKTIQADPSPYRKALRAVSAPILKDACEPKTINYITHSLPQQCLRSKVASATKPSSYIHNTLSNAGSQLKNERQAEQDTTNILQPSKCDDDKDLHATEQSLYITEGSESSNSIRKEDGDLLTVSFPSFDEWMGKMLRKQSQEVAEGRSRRNLEGHGARRDEIDSLGEDDEIDLNFDVLTDKMTQYAARYADERQTKEKSDDQQRRETLSSSEDQSAAPVVRSKDAGKTCKERFSYASFDAGATVLKTSAGAKNAKAILVETKDTYMLLECAKTNKFVIVEMSDDILVDTIVLANFEFFSSMMRHFRVSVSDRYPVKADKWKLLGTFETRNSRDIQAFLVEHPLIWAKYIKIDFLTHYGNEYYCPISLLRVHGTRMLETWKDSEPGSQDEDSGEDEEEQVGEAKEEVGVRQEYLPISQSVTNFESPSPVQEPTHETCQFQKDNENLAVFRLAECRNMCPTNPPTIVDGSSSSYIMKDITANFTTLNQTIGHRARIARNADGRDPLPKMETACSGLASSFVPPSSSPSSPLPSRSTWLNSSASAAVSTESTRVPTGPNTKGNYQSAVSSSTPTSTRNKTSTSPGLPSPTVQESFFKTVTKRLSSLESNTTLSMQYIETQSRFLQQTLQNLEKKQLSRVSSFLDQLNSTVLSELHAVKQQYEQIWQSTVLALEAQREQSVRETFALSQRMELLADEVVFQKRIAIAQSVLLLACLGLVIFGQRGGNSSIVTFFENPRAAWLGVTSPITSRASRSGRTRLDHVSGVSTPLRRMFTKSSSSSQRSWRMENRTSISVTPSLESDNEESTATPITMKPHREGDNHISQEALSICHTGSFKDQGHTIVGNDKLSQDPEISQKKKDQRRRLRMNKVLSRDISLPFEHEEPLDFSDLAEKSDSVNSTPEL